MMIRRLAFLACLSAFLALPSPVVADTGGGSATVVLVDVGVAPSSLDAGVAPSSLDAAAVAPAAVDAGVASPGAAATPVVVTVPVVVPEPIENPSGFIATVKKAWSVGWPIALLVALVGLLEGAIYAFGNVEALKKLGQGRTTVLIGGALAVLTAVLAAAGDGGNWTAAIIAGAAAGLAYWHQSGTDPKKS